MLATSTVEKTFIFFPDDPNMPPSMRNTYKCEKTPTGPLDRKKLLDFINDQAMNEPDVPDAVPYVSGTVRGKKWVPPPKVRHFFKLIQHCHLLVSVILRKQTFAKVTKSHSNAFL